MNRDYIKFYPVKVLKSFLKHGDISLEEFKKLVKKEYWPKILRKEE